MGMCHRMPSGHAVLHIRCMGYLVCPLVRLPKLGAVVWADGREASTLKLVDGFARVLKMYDVTQAITHITRATTFER